MQIIGTSGARVDIHDNLVMKYGSESIGDDVARQGQRIQELKSQNAPRVHAVTPSLGYTMELLAEVPWDFIRLGAGVLPVIIYEDLSNVI